ncbi:unnamed protein product [Camellia sinensis]
MAKEGEATSKTIPFEDGWPVLQDAINKLIDNLERVCPHTFTSEEYMTLYTFPAMFPRFSDDISSWAAVTGTTSMETVYGEMNDQVRDVVISMKFDQKREGGEIDQALVKNVLDIYTEMGEGSMKYYQKDFEEAMLVDTAAFYSQKASIWITSESYKDYVLKVERCLKQETDRVSCYLQHTSQQKLLEVVEHELLFVFASKLEEKKQLDSEAA